MKSIPTIHSAAAGLLAKTDRRVWQRGEAYADAGKVKVIRADEKSVEAAVAGTEVYRVRLSFPGRGIGKQCTCYYAAGGQSQYAVCKHMVAVALIWDYLRGLPRPSAGQVAQAAIPPRDNSYRRLVKAVYDDPLHADLDLLRTMVDQSGRWTRPHSHLPERPAFCHDPGTPLAAEEAREAFREIASWRRRPRYDPYFCAGEMMAAFCEVLRSIRARMEVSDTRTVVEILLAARRFHNQLVCEYLDSSDGVQVFSDSHLEDIYESARQKFLKNQEDQEAIRLLRQYENERERG